NLKENYNTYHNHFLSKFPERFSETIEQNRRNHYLQTITMIEQFNTLIEELFSSMQQTLSNDIQRIIKIQIDSIKSFPPILPTNPIIELPTSQYYCMQTIKNYIGPRD
ncbi:6793_t:CDS:1, partial [Diversispora eburnea]